MRLLQGLLAVGTLAVLCYTGLVMLEYGANFWPTYLSGIAGMGWQGQFNLDFSIYLGLSGLWVAWRHRFSAPGVLVGLIASVGGLCFFGPYLLWASFQAESLEGLLLGERA